MDNVERWEDEFMEHLKRYKSYGFGKAHIIALVDRVFDNVKSLNEFKNDHD